MRPIGSNKRFAISKPRVFRQCHISCQFAPVFFNPLASGMVKFGAKLFIPCVYLRLLTLNPLTGDWMPWIMSCPAKFLQIILQTPDGIIATSKATPPNKSISYLYYTESLLHYLFRLPEVIKKPSIFPYCLLTFNV